MQTNRIVIPYLPRPQFKPYHDRKERWSIIVAHRRFGKTVGCINDLIRDAVRCDKEEPRFAYVAPTYAQAKDVAWGYLKHFSAPVPEVQPNESELHVTFKHNGARIRLYGSDNYDRMRGIYLDGVVMDEYGDQDPRAWTEVIRPALSDRKGWGTFIGTPRGNNHFKALWDDEQNEWFRLMLKASSTNILDQEELYDARKHMSEEQYNAEYECSFAGSLVGAYYAKEIEDLRAKGSLKGEWWRPDYTVHTAWDVGGTTAIWFFQAVDGLVHIIDYLEGNNQTAAWYADKLRARPYKYGQHILPSDAGDPKEVIAHSWIDALARMDITGVHLLPKQRSIDDGINAFKILLPRCRFSEKCKEGLDALVNYRRKWDDKRKCFYDHPEHDWASHGSDAARHLALGIESVTRIRTKPVSMQIDFSGGSYMGN